MMAPDSSVTVPATVPLLIDCGYVVQLASSARQTRCRKRLRRIVLSPLCLQKFLEHAPMMETERSRAIANVSAPKLNGTYLENHWKRRSARFADDHQRVSPVLIPVGRPKPPNTSRRKNVERRYRLDQR